MTALEDARIRRNAAKAAFDARFGAFQDELGKRGIKEQITSRASADARHLADQALDIASNSKGIIAATIGALAVWFLRQPILALIESRFDASEIENADTDESPTEAMDPTEVLDGA